MLQTTQEALLDRIYESGNLKVTFDEFTLMRQLNVVGGYISPYLFDPAGHNTYFCGKKVIPCESGYILFEQCEYCGNIATKKTQTGFVVCVTCGAPVSAKG